MGLLRRRRRRSPLGWAIYLLIVAAGAAALWTLIPPEVWKTIRETYFAR